ncbi:uncharacterized protein LOC123560746 isoform X2 [Mercenaria mercenaria]|uniref:uncharacterized protein LOC123560746 isoform X2 n=1 Tax=Mercenaria mercenaria TaxID=6596 RepID=UPI00234F0674|nr:uncharacterized protein LOC123560746 isoform X2 [Mercenaria mercenaria]
MYEGKNIHYAQSADQKPLCSFSGKICNQRRLNHYGFCVRHILEDPTAPFKRCGYVAKSSRQTCTQPIPKNEEREYCNNHMQVLGMLPKKERKPKKEKERHGSLSNQFHLGGAKSDPGLLQNKIRPRLTVGGIKSKLMPNKLSSGGEDMEDVYAFPTDSTEKKVKELTAVISNVTLPNVSVSVTVSPMNTLGATVSKSPVDAGQSSLAKIYPELAEKLEKIKPKMETKTKGKVKSSRTMNSLQTKIAQNKIKDKLKRNQCSSNNSSQSQSPSHSYTSSPGYQINSSSPNHPQTANSPANSAPPNVTVVRDGINSVVDVSAALGAASAVNVAPVPSLSHLNLLNGLNLQTLNMSLEQLGLPVPTVSDIEQTLKQLASAANIPLEGNQMFSNETGLSAGVPEPQVGTVLHPAPELQHLLPQTFTPQSRPPPPYSSVHHKPSSEVLQTVSVSNVSNTVTQTGQVIRQGVKSEFITGHQIRPVTSTPQSSSSSSSASQVVNVPLVTRQFLPNASPSGVKVVPTSTTALLSSSTTSSLAAPLSSPLLHFPGQPKLTLLTTSQTPTSVSSKVTESAKQSLNFAGFQQPKTKVTKSRPRSRNPSSTSKRPVPLFSLPMTLVKPRKIRKLLDDEDVKKLKTKSAIEYYNMNKQKKIDQHSMICSSVASSDESDLSDCDMLPWQPDWFLASSDEEIVEDEEDDDGLRTAKLALGRARLRRQCSQARRSSLMNKNTNVTTSSLITAVRESQKSTVKCLQEIKCTKSKSPERLKSKGLVKRRCLYRDDNELQCKHSVVPYTNHCIKHVMYNVDQQLFEYCTAKFADNTQCCHPVIDVKHELPLCMEHGVKADNFLKAQDLEPKPKRPRKKTKPSALTRPPKKGKKKRNQRKSVRPQKPLPPDSEDQEAMESDTEEVSSQPLSEMNADSDSDKGESQSSSTDVNEKPVLPQAEVTEPEPVASRPSSMVVKDGVKPGTSVLKEKMKLASTGQLEELDNFTSLSELENVKMFGDLETTASKLLEENDFQEVLSRLPDVAFDIFNSKSSGLPGTDELQDFEDSLALANRELKMTKDTQESVVSTAKPPPTSRQPVQAQTPLAQHVPVAPRISQPQAPVAPILEDSDDFTRQIAEEIMKQNIGPSMSMGESLCNGDAEESIKAIARSLSNSGMMLAAEAKHKSHSQEVFTSNQSSQSLSHAQSLPVYSNLDSVYYPPNVALQNIQVSSSQQATGLVPTCVMSKTQGQVAQGQVSYAGQMSSNLVPQNVTVTPQGIITSHVGSARLGPGSQTVTIGNTTVTGNQTAGIITLPVQQQLTAQQLSALVQQATAHLPPLPPYTPRQQTSAPVSTTTQPSQPVSAPNPKPLSQEQLIQHLAKQQEQLGEQQQLLAQQILQQRLAVLTQHPMPVKVTLPSTQNLGFSTILHQGPVAQLGRLNQGVIHAIPNVGQIAQMIKTTLPTSQKISAPASLPTTNIVWTSPPNVTITSPNGLPRTVAQTFVSGAKATTTNPKGKASTLNETFIDLTESNDPPPYEATITSQGKTQPPPSYPTQTSSNTVVTGKS